MKGHQGIFLYINLQDRTSEKEERDDSRAQRFNRRKEMAPVLLQENKNMNSLNPNSILLFRTGPLNGTHGPNSRPWVTVTNPPGIGLFIDSEKKLLSPNISDSAHRILWSAAMGQKGLFHIEKITEA